MAGGTKSVDEVVMPKDTQELKRICIQAGVDLLNRRRDEKEVRGFAKMAATAYEIGHMEIRSAVTRKALGEKNAKIEPLPI